MNNAEYQNYITAGKIAAEARDYGVRLLKPGALLLDVATKIETKIKEAGAKLAFPVNIALNTLAAHYSPRHDDLSTFKKGDVVKLDVGAHINGFIADTAITVEIDTHDYETMIRASSEALDKTIQALNTRTPLHEVGRIIETTITAHGFKPIDNLMGHGLARYELHSGISVPNIEALGSKATLSDGDVVAIEPFATNGAGHVTSAEGSNIYVCNDSLKARFIRDKKKKMLYEKIKNQFNTLPFAQRWCHELSPTIDDHALKKLSFIGLTKHFPQLIEVKHGIVTQKEHTLIVREDGCEVIT